MKEPSTPPPQNDDILTHSTTLITTLLTTHLPQIHHFKTKWSLLKSTLLSLQSHLSDFSLPTTTPTSSSSSLSHSLLSSLSTALSSATSLAAVCASSSPLPAGKLRTQSDLDSLSSTLHSLNKDCEILLNSGLLLQQQQQQHPLDYNTTPSTTTTTSNTTTNSTNNPIVVMGSKETIRVEVRNLLTRLQIGTIESKYSAIEKLVALINEDDKNVMIAVAQGIVPVLVKSLDCASAEMREKTVTAIARVASVESSKHVLVAEGLLLLNQLIRVIESGSVYAKERACVALQALSYSKENARAIGCRGGISSLLEICHGGTPNSQAVAAGVLRNLALFEEVKENFVEEEAVPVLLAVGASGTTVARENAIGCVSNLVSGDETLKVLVAREGGIECLKNYWDSTPIGKSLEVAIELLINLGSYHPIGEVLIFHGFTLKLLPLLECGVLTVRTTAARAVFELGFCSKARREMGECGCVSALVRMLDGKAVEEREAAAKALSNLMVCTINKKLFKKEEKGVLSVVQLLDPLTKNVDKKWPVLVLSSLVGSKKCRKQMVAAGAIAYLHKLVELDVEGAKKLLDSLGPGKLWGVFARS